MLNPTSIISARAVRKASRRRGSMMVYCIFIMLVSCAMIFLAVDYGRLQMIKSQEQRSADSLARGLLTTLLVQQPTIKAYGMTNAQAAPYLVSMGVAAKIEAANPIDANSGIQPNYNITFGSWYGSAFHADGGTVGPLAVQVIVSRTVATGNPVPLAFPLPNGKTFVSKTFDVWAKAIAVLPNAISFNDGVQGTQDPWLSGMPVGSTASDVDSVTTNSVTAASNPSNGYDPNTTLTVIPGSTINWSSVTGQSAHGVPAVFYGPDGQTDAMWWHLKDSLNGNYATEPEGDGGQNGIGDINAPLTALIGVFLDNDAPNAADNTAYANYANANMRSFSSDYDSSNTVADNLNLQQPFYIGDGTNSAGNNRSFVVPQNATRLFLGTMDGYQWANNAGSFTVVGSEQPPIEMVQ